MNSPWRKAWTIYKYASVAFSVVYWIYVIIDDFSLIERYGDSEWLTYIGLWLLYFLMYFLGFTFYYWLLAVVAVLVHSRILNGQKKRR